jgi:hypothetical protein
MPATAVTVARPTIDGVVTPAAVNADATNGNSVPNLAGLILTLKNTDTNPHDVVFQTPVTHGGYAVADKTVTIAAGVTKNFSNFPSDSFGRTLTFTANATTVTIIAMAPAS